MSDPNPKFNPMHDGTLWQGLVRWFKRERYRRKNRLTHGQLRAIEAESAQISAAD